MKLGAELLRQGAGDQPPEDVAHDESADSAVWFLEGDEAAEADGREDGWGYGRCGEAVGRLGELLGGVI